MCNTKRIYLYNTRWKIVCEEGGEFIAFCPKGEYKSSEKWARTSVELFFNPFPCYAVDTEREKEKKKIVRAKKKKKIESQRKSV